MERISIFNYEAFYLDFLEGNLNEEDTALLIAFLDANPDLKMEDDSLPTFEGEELKLDAALKNDLKQPLMDGAITDNNVEYFMISDAEGLLDEAKTAELEKYVEGDAKLEREKALYGAVYFEPDMSVGYTEKEGLKRKTVVLWQYITIAAAASVIAFFLVWSSINNGPVTEQGTYFVEDGQNETPSNDEDNQSLNSEDQQPNNVPQVANEESNSGNADVYYVQPTPNDEEDKRPSDMSIDKMERRSVGNIVATIDNRDIEPISKRTFPTVTEDVQTQDNNTLAFNEMQNPIAPITEFVEKKTNREVDFRRTKKTEGKPGGFFLKIGKFELSRKRH